MIGSLCRLPAALRLAGRSRPSGYFRQQLSQGGPNANGEGSGSKEAVERLVRAHPVVVFMKGSPAQPQCGFSNAVVQILRLHGVNDYRAYDVLQDPDLRQVKEASWTYLMTEQVTPILAVQTKNDKPQTFSLQDLLSRGGGRTEAVVVTVQLPACLFIKEHAHLRSICLPSSELGLSEKNADNC